MPVYFYRQPENLMNQAIMNAAGNIGTGLVYRISPQGRATIDFNNDPGNHFDPDTGQLRRSANRRARRAFNQGMEDGTYNTSQNDQGVWSLNLGRGNAPTGMKAFPTPVPPAPAPPTPAPSPAPISTSANITPINVADLEARYPAPAEPTSLATVGDNYYMPTQPPQLLPQLRLEPQIPTPQQGLLQLLINHGTRRDWQDYLTQPRLEPQIPTSQGFMQLLRSREEGGPVDKPTNQELEQFLSVLNADRGGIPIIAHPGEYVINADAVDAIGEDRLESLNQLGRSGLPHYQEGGSVFGEPGYRYSRHDRELPQEDYEQERLGQAAMREEAAAIQHEERLRNDPAYAYQYWTDVANRRGDEASARQVEAARQQAQYEEALRARSEGLNQWGQVPSAPTSAGTADIGNREVTDIQRMIAEAQLGGGRPGIFGRMSDRIRAQLSGPTLGETFADPTRQDLRSFTEQFRTNDPAFRGLEGLPLQYEGQPAPVVPPAPNYQPYQPPGFTISREPTPERGDHAASSDASPRPLGEGEARRPTPPAPAPEPKPTPPVVPPVTPGQTPDKALRHKDTHPPKALSKGESSGLPRNVPLGQRVDIDWAALEAMTPGQARDYLEAVALAERGTGVMEQFGLTPNREQQMSGLLGQYQNITGEQAQQLGNIYNTNTMGSRVGLSDEAHRAAMQQNDFASAIEPMELLNAVYGTGMNRRALELFDDTYSAQVAAPGLQNAYTQASIDSMRAQAEAMINGQMGGAGVPGGGIDMADFLRVYDTSQDTITDSVNMLRQLATATDAPELKAQYDLAAAYLSGAIDINNTDPEAIAQIIDADVASNGRRFMGMTFGGREGLTPAAIHTARQLALQSQGDQNILRQLIGMPQGGATQQVSGSQGVGFYQ